MTGLTLRSLLALVSLCVDCPSQRSLDQFSVIFGLLTLLHLALNIRHGRAWYFVVLIGTAGEFGGWVARAFSGQCVTRRLMALTAQRQRLRQGRGGCLPHVRAQRRSRADIDDSQIIMLTILPVFYSGALYGLQVVIAHVHPMSRCEDMFRLR